MPGPDGARASHPIHDRPAAGGPGGVKGGAKPQREAERQRSPAAALDAVWRAAGTNDDRPPSAGSPMLEVSHPPAILRSWTDSRWRAQTC